MNIRENIADAINAVLVKYEIENPNLCSDLADVFTAQVSGLYSQMASLTKAVNSEFGVSEELTDRLKALEAAISDAITHIRLEDVDSATSTLQAVVNEPIV